MRTLVKLLSQGVEAPIMVDTTEVEVAAAALRQIPGRAILNSVHLEAGREKLDRLLPHVVEHGAALVALTIDESGMAKTADRKVAVAREDPGYLRRRVRPGPLRSHLRRPHLHPGHRVKRSTRGQPWRRWRESVGSRNEIPGALTSLGVSNVSFGLQPQARLRPQLRLPSPCGGGGAGHGHPEPGPHHALP